MRAIPQAVDAVFHVAGSSNLWSRGNAGQTAINVDGTRNVVEAALARRAKKLIFTSSWVTYGDQTGRFDETADKRGRLSWVNHYHSKFLAEEEVRKGIARGLDATIMNPSLIMGPGDTNGWARIIKQIHSGSLPGVPPWAVSFAHVREVARAHIAAAEVGRTGENYLLGGADATFLELVQIIGRVAGRAVPDKALPAWALRLLGRFNQWGSYFTGRAPDLTPETAFSVTRRMACDCSKAQRELGYRPVALEAIVEDSYRWLEREGLLKENRG
jgi:nucleoside-diphosphate-sugar epimerase